MKKEQKTIYFNIPSNHEDARKLLIDLEDQVGVILSDSNGKYIVLPYKKTNYRLK